MKQSITIPLIIQFLGPYSSANTSQKGLQDYLLIGENTAKNFRSGRSLWVNEEKWVNYAQDYVKPVFDAITVIANGYNNHMLFQGEANHRKRAMEKAFDRYINTGVIENPWLSGLFKDKFCSSTTFRMPTFTFFLRNYIYLQLTAIVSDNNMFNCHTELMKFMTENRIQEHIITDFNKISEDDFNTIASFLASKAFASNFNTPKHITSTGNKSEPFMDSTQFMFPFYIDSFYINSIYEQLLVYTEKEILKPQKTNHSQENSNIDINELYIKEQPLNVSDQRKLLMIIHSINNSSLIPMHLYDCLTQLPNKNLVFVTGSFRLMGIYDAARNPVDETTYEPAKDNLFWHLEYVNTGVDGTDFSHLEGDQYICEYAKGRDTIYHISMNLSGDKFILSPRHVTHLIKRFGTFKLKVLGHLIRDPHDTTTLSIKPLAVFHES